MAIVHEWVAATAGSEKVFDALAACFPQADLYCLTAEPRVRLPTLDTRSVQSTALDSPFWRKNRQLSLPLMPVAWRMLDREPYDVVISSSHAFARYFCDGRDGHHFCYTHAPMRYAWTPELDERGRSLGRLSPMARSILKRMDTRTIQHTDFWAANSSEVARRLNRFYGVDSEVIHPPVDVDRFVPGNTREEYVVAFSRFVPYKRLDLAIDAAEIARLPLIIMGSGPGADEIAALARNRSVPVDILNRPSDAVVEEVMSRGRALLFPAKEDFGIVAVEAQAAGMPVVAVRGYGADDSVVHGQTGALVDSQTAEDLAGGLKLALELDSPQEKCRQNAERFAPANFESSVQRWVDRCLSGADKR